MFWSVIIQAREESLQTTPKLDSLSRIKYGIIKSPWSGCQPSRKDLGTSNVSGVSNPSILMPNTPARGRSNISMDPKSCAGKSGNSFPSSTIDCELHQKSVSLLPASEVGPFIYVVVTALSYENFSRWFTIKCSQLP